MYNSIEITEIIGSVYVEGHSMNSISITEVRSIMSRVKDADPFISVRLSGHGIKKALILANQTATSKPQSIIIPNDDKIHSRFIREYYKLDSYTRAIVSKIINDFFKNEEI